MVGGDQLHQCAISVSDYASVHMCWGNCKRWNAEWNGIWNGETLKKDDKRGVVLCGHCQQVVELAILKFASLGSAAKSGSLHDVLHCYACIPLLLVYLSTILYELLTL